MNRTSTQKRAAWARLNQLYNKSELTLQAFCQQHGLNKHTFQYWRSKFRKEEKKPASFQQIVPPPSQKKLKLNQNLQLHLSGGSYLEIPAGYPQSELITLLKGLN